MRGYVLLCSMCVLMYDYHCHTYYYGYDVLFCSCYFVSVGFLIIIFFVFSILYICMSIHQCWNAIMTCGSAWSLRSSRYWCVVGFIFWRSCVHFKIAGQSFLKHTVRHFFLNLWGQARWLIVSQVSASLSSTVLSFFFDFWLLWNNVSVFHWQNTVLSYYLSLLE